MMSCVRSWRSAIGPANESHSFVCCTLRLRNVLEDSPPPSEQNSLSEKRKEGGGESAFSRDEEKRHSHQTRVSPFVFHTSSPSNICECAWEHLGDDKDALIRANWNVCT